MQCVQVNAHFAQVRGLPARIGLSVVTICMTLNFAYAGNQQEETLSSALQTVLHAALLDEPLLPGENTGQDQLSRNRMQWMQTASPAFNQYLESRRTLIASHELVDGEVRRAFLQTLWYEATRAGLDPALVLGVIEVESGFNKFAISAAGAIGYMQVMPFWVVKARALDQKNVPGNAPQVEKADSADKYKREPTIQEKRQASALLMQTHINLRFGCAILRNYLDTHEHDIVRALKYYNGDISDPSYALKVLSAAQHWNALLH